MCRNDAQRKLQKNVEWGPCALRHWIQSSMEATLACHPAVSTEWLAGWQFTVYYDVCARPPLRAQNSAKNNVLPLWLETYLAWTFLFLCSFLNNYPWTFEKKSFFNQLYKKWAENKKKLGVAGWKVGQTWHWDNCSHTKKYNKNTEKLLAKQNFSLLIWDRLLKFMLQHPTVWFDRKQSKYPSKELLLYDFLHKRSIDVWKTVTNSACGPLYQ